MSASINTLHSTANWEPSSSLATLRQRAHILKIIRDFFFARGVMEVETPLLCRASVTDPFIQSIPALFQSRAGAKEEYYYLQTSPEYAMKRLLAAGSGAIFQLTKAFRQGETGRFHNPEFSMLEWYRPGFDHHDLMNEMDELLQITLGKSSAERCSYRDVFLQHLNLDPHHASLQDLEQCAVKNSLQIAGEIDDKDTWLQLLMSEYIEKRVGQDRPCFIYDFPASQAALARIKPGDPPTASRFEVYYQGIELANGFHELQDASEQRHRFKKNLQERARLGLPEMEIDELFLTALEHGLPDCAGVALGIDRLIMLAAGKDSLSEVLAFDFSRA
ncbi:Elongation factor P--(R)-beta-lysine ligase [Aquicella siphonis]|uniref:Elongation factor P--(R)-beta-lysine ligase n=1 Tax=Aquicella siphonis TaxID=254247 RepID=A0A5E4PJU3_9COXI|nr:elongation factor P--(R)-beta-lysine ligase [Aquicella siphonis]VVC76835.1 Elongation factor P--(R)-beta-lysine ligase [Aquicella siphonis]